VSILPRSFIDVQTYKPIGDPVSGIGAYQLRWRHDVIEDRRNAPLEAIEQCKPVFSNPDEQVNLHRL
jgi:hypothetical protein